jgi:antitoxin YefM
MRLLFQLLKLVASSAAAGFLKCTKNDSASAYPMHCVKRISSRYLYKIVDKYYNVHYTCTTNHTSQEDIMRIVNFSEARNNLKSVLDQVIDDADYTIITRRDSEDAVVMSLETFNSLMETFYLLRSPANAAHLTKSIEQFKNGQVQERVLIDE